MSTHVRSSMYGIIYQNKIDEWIDIDFVSGNTH